jgi:3',5'-cyclic AMP phosphodiesterase CpdA
MFTLAHLSDPHLGPFPAIRLHQILNKRLTGVLNWHRGRGESHSMAELERLCAHLKSHNPTHIAVTGDVTNLGLENEFRRANTWLHSLGTAENLSFIPGNHDAYLGECTRFLKNSLGTFMTNDNGHFEGFPYVRLRGPIAVVGISSAIPTAPLMASGAVGIDQRVRLRKVLLFLKQQNLARVLLIHHPPHHKGATLTRRLRDARALSDILAETGAELILHGHNHVHEIAHMKGPNGLIPVWGAPSASASGRKGHYAGYHLFHFDMTDNGIRITARLFMSDGRGTITDSGDRPV